MKEEKSAQTVATLPPDDTRRNLAIARPNEDESLRHIGLVGDTYTILVTGKETDGKYCLIDMHVPSGGGPPPHRHDFEEMFTVLEGELEFTFRGEKSIARAGENVNIPANAPHQFHKSSQSAVRMLCMCTPAGQEEFFMEVGVPGENRMTPPPKLSGAELAELKAKVEALSPLPVAALTAWQALEAGELRSGQKVLMEATSRKKLIMAGLINHVCIVFPSISAVEEGFKVQAVY